MSCTEKGALHDSNEGRSRFQGAFAEAVEIHVSSSDARLQGECMSETLLCRFQKHPICRKVSFALKAYSLNLISKLEYVT